ncbi:hypothetical protein N8H30_004337 [Salmonella enterica]|nr:hypothetical protein [Salmonella enterica]ECY2495407.1 hypothetical protein [Salmonella enterica]EDZ6275353.1 hypothetical protein [Salmonella enterica]EJW0033259.1 hypothetical protein [Salmonella enterica]
MNPQRRTPEQYFSLEDLLVELNDAGHPNSLLWYVGQVIHGARSPCRIFIGRLQTYCSDAQKWFLVDTLWIR